MKRYSVLTTLCLLLLGNLCLAQRSVEPAIGHFGFSSNHFFTTEFTEVEFQRIRPLRASYALDAGLNLGNHWAIGAQMDNRYRQQFFSGLIIANQPISVVGRDLAVLELRRYSGYLDLYGRYYVQPSSNSFRVYGQLGYGLGLRYWESQRLRPADQTEFDEPVVNRFLFNGHTIVVGAGAQYRFAPHWSVALSSFLRWPVSNALDFGLQLGLARVLVAS
ncbi:MAG: outer membrane beta-barrel protein [Bacteroidota bacterium]